MFFDLSFLYLVSISNCIPRGRLKWFGRGQRQLSEEMSWGGGGGL